eukprot:15462140-Alexandrium_andersonii.AAC.1
MHCNCLGNTQALNGNIIWELVTAGHWGGPVEVALEKALREYLAWCKEHRVANKISKLTLDTSQG